MLFLPKNASRARAREAENARQNRLDVVKALSWGQISRRDLVKLGLVTTGGLLVPKNGFSPFARSAFGAVPTGTPPSPLFGAQPFTQPLLVLEEIERHPITDCSPNPLRMANTDPINNDRMPGIVSPCEGRPPGEMWAHQRWGEFPPQVYCEEIQAAVGVNPRGNVEPRFHPAMPIQGPDKIWTFGGTFPPKLVMGRYGEPILFRHHNRLPGDVSDNGGFGRHTITTHNHNGHNGAESDGFANAFFFPGQFYDYHWPIMLARHDELNTDATDIRAGMPRDDGGIDKIPGDYRETMSTHWFHDHMLDFTSQNVYKGNAAMFNLYSAVDRGNEEINDGVNLRLPSGTAKAWGNRDYDINLMLADKATDQQGQMFFDIFNFDGFIGDLMTVNFLYKPYMEVEARKYRFRILNASVSRFFKVALSDGSPIIQIGNDGNLLARPVVLTALDQQGIAERYDIVIDFSRYSPGQKVWMVNLTEHSDGKKPSKDYSIADAIAGKSKDPCVGKFMEFRIIPRSKPDLSQVPDTLIPLPDMIPIVRERTFEFGNSGGSDSAPWTIKTDGGAGLPAAENMNRVSAAPMPGTAEIWHLKNGGGGWDHPIHIHFEEGRILARNDGPVQPWEALARKDVYRLHPGGEVTIYIRFGEFAGTFMEHCHNTVHEDHAMLLRWDLQRRDLIPLPTPVPTPTGVTYEVAEILPTAFTPSSSTSTSTSTSTSSTSVSSSSTSTTTTTTLKNRGKGRK